MSFRRRFAESSERLLFDSAEPKIEREEKEEEVSARSAGE